MNAAAVVLSPANPSDTAFPSLIVDGGPGVSDQTDAQPNVGQVRLSHDQREAAIRKAGDLIVRYMALANENGADYFTYRGLADRARLSMEALIKGRAADWKRQA